MPKYLTSYFCVLLTSGSKRSKSALLFIFHSIFLLTFSSRVTSDWTFPRWHLIEFHVVPDSTFRQYSDIISALSFFLYDKIHFYISTWHISAQRPIRFMINVIKSNYITISSSSNMHFMSFCDFRFCFISKFVSLLSRYSWLQHYCPTFSQKMIEWRCAFRLGKTKTWR